ncbi:MAG: hypothetical protein ACXWN9_16140, partial [Candidatus Binataceae bacterium]
ALLDRMRERLHRHPREGAPPQAHSGPPSSASSATHPATLDHAATTTPAPASAKAAAPEHPTAEPAASEKLISVNGVAGGTGGGSHGDGAHDAPHKAAGDTAEESPPHPEPNPHKPEPS